MRKRDKWVHVKVTDGERDDWKRKSIEAGMPVADMIRRKMNTAEVGRRVASVKTCKLGKVDPDLLAGITRIGNNLNQIARWANTYKKSADAVEIISYLLVFERMLKSFLGKVILKKTPNAR